LGASLALSSATVASGESGAHPHATATPIKCNVSSAKAYCLTVQNTGAGNALEGQAKSGTGVFGTSSGGNGVYAASKSADAVSAHSSAGNGIYAISAYGYGIFGASSSSDGLHGVSSGGNGVYGATNATSGNAGVSGVSASASGSGVGVSGQSSNGNGVSGSSTLGTAAGVYGFATNGTGVLAESQSSSSIAPALYALADESDTNIFIGLNLINGGVNCTIDNEANLACTGKVSSGEAMQVRHTSSKNRQVLSYASESATPTIEDLGVARLRDGAGNVEIPADFASVMDRSNPYYVFLTPMGDTRGLYVSAENGTAFEVHENMRGRSSVLFQYRIIAVPLGVKNVRLPSAPEIKLPKRLTKR